MKNLVLLLFFTLLIVSCSSSRRITGISNESITIADDPGRDGSSFEKAIFIKENTENAGISAEYAWIQKHYPGYKFLSQSLSDHNKKSYDIINIQTQGGEKIDIYFDISNFFGKF